MQTFSLAWPQSHSLIDWWQWVDEGEQPVGSTNEAWPCDYSRMFGRWSERRMFMFKYKSGAFQGLFRVLSSFISDVKYLFSFFFFLHLTKIYWKHMWVLLSQEEFETQSELEPVQRTRMTSSLPHPALLEDLSKTCGCTLPPLWKDVCVSACVSVCVSQSVTHPLGFV